MASSQIIKKWKAKRESLGLYSNSNPLGNYQAPLLAAVFSIGLGIACLYSEPSQLEEVVEETPVIVMEAPEEKSKEEFRDKYRFEGKEPLRNYWPVE